MANKPNKSNDEKNIKRSNMKEGRKKQTRTEQGGGGGSKGGGGQKPK